MTAKPAPGDVVTYPFLWKREQHQGETDGRKPRPVCMAVTLSNSDGHTVLFIVPITTRPPSKDRIAVEVPTTEVRRAGLDLGAFGRKFTNDLQRRLLSALKSGTVASVNRID